MKAVFKYVNWPGFLLLAVLAGCWELAAAWAQSPVFPGFSAVVVAFFTHGQELADALGVTLVRAAAGFFLALVTMLPLGIFLGRMRRVAAYVEPVIDMVRPLPPLAVVPVAMLFAGTGSWAKILVVFYGASFPILINAIDATRSVHPLLVQVGRSIGLSRAEIMLRLDLPAALPQIFGGMRISVAMSLLISVGAEMLLSSNGIGNFIVVAQEQFQIATGLATILVIALVVLVIEALFMRAEHHLLAWHYRRGALSS